MRPIKIVLALEAAEGGALKHLVYLISGLDRNRFDVTVVLSRSRRVNIDIEIRSIQSSGAKLIFLPIRRSISPLSDVTNLLRLHRILSTNRFDVAHAHSSKAGVLLRLAAWINNVPLILYTPHCFYFQALRGMKRKCFALIERVMARITSAIIVSGGERNEALRERICPPGKLRSINNAIKFTNEPGEILVDQIKKQLGINSRYVVGSVGRLTRQKNFGMFILAACEVIRSRYDVTFLICGEGEMRKELESLARTLEIGNNVKFLGHFDSVKPVYQILDVYVNTSDWEGLPYTILEAIHHRLPVVVTDAMQNDLLKDNVSSFIVPRRDHKFCGKRICQLLDESHTRSYFVNNCSAMIKAHQYSYARFVKEHTKIYSSILT